MLRGVVKYLRFIVIAFIVGPSLAFAQIDTERVISIGQNAMYFKDYLLAIQYFNSAIQSAPHLAEPYYYRGVAKYNLDDLLGAESDCNNAIQRNPYVYDAYYLRGIIRHAIGKDSLALNDYNVVLHNNPDHQGALHNTALLMIASKDSVGARTVLDHLHKYYPRYAQGYLVDGGLQLELGDTIQALSLFEKALQLNPNLPGAYLSMASIAYDQSDFKQAEVYMNRAIEQMPDEVSMYVNRGIIRYQQYNYKGAMSDYSTAIELDPNNSLALYNRALLRTQVGEINEAHKDFNTVASLEPNNYFALFNRALISNEVGEFAMAESDLNKIIERYPTFLPALVQRAQARKGQGKSQGAKEDLYLASKMTYDKPTLQNATRKQLQQDAKDTDRVREQKDQNIQKFRSLVYASQAKAYGERYKEEDEGIRGRLQDKDVMVEPEPLFTLSYYDNVTDQIRSRTNVYYSTALNLPFASYGVFVVQKIPQLTQAMLQKHFDRLKEINCDTLQSVEALLKCALNQLSLKDHKAVVETMTLIANLDPNNPVPYFQRATSRFLAYEAKSASEIKKKTAGFQWFGASDIDEMSIAYKQKKKVGEDSINDLEIVLNLVPNFPPALFNLGYISASIGFYKQAIEYYTQAIEVAPEMGAAYFNRGLCYYAVGEKEKGDRDLSQAGALGYYKAYPIIKRMK